MNLQDPVGSYRILENTVESRAVARMRQTEALASVICFRFLSHFFSFNTINT